MHVCNLAYAWLVNSLLKIVFSLLFIYNVCGAPKQSHNLLSYFSKKHM